MKFDNKKIIEIFLGLILVILLIILIFLFTQGLNLINTQIPKIQICQNITISNSYSQILSKENFTKIYSKINYKNKELISYENRSKKEILKGVFGNDIIKYIVYIKNIENKSRYFKVQFKLSDCYEKETFASITKYIPIDCEEKFIYIDIKNKYCDWEYIIYKQ
jgi:hypothetical protein